MVVATVVTHLFLVAMIGASEAVSDAELLAQAEAAFRRGTEARDHPEQARPLFRQAAHGYEALRRRGTQNTDLFRNEGHASLLAGDLPQAILSYRRGLRL